MLYVYMEILKGKVKRFDLYQESFLTKYRHIVCDEIMY